VGLVAWVTSLWLRWEAPGVWGGEETVDEVCLVAGVTSLFLRWEAPGVWGVARGSSDMVARGSSDMVRYYTIHTFHYTVHTTVHPKLPNLFPKLTVCSDVNAIRAHLMLLYITHVVLVP